MSILDAIMGRQPIPTPQEQAGGIPQNAQVRGGRPPPPSMTPSPVTPATPGDVGSTPAQMLPQGAMIAPAQQPQGAMPPMPQPMQNNPQIMQALQQRLQQQQGGGAGGIMDAITGQYGLGPWTGYSSERGR